MTTRKSESVSSAATPAPQREEAPSRQPRRALPAPREQQLERRPDPGDSTATAADRMPMAVDCSAPESEPLRESLRRRIVGQDDVIDALVCAWSRLLAGLRDPERPLLTGLLLGPTGVGKTETARALAEALFGTPSALLRINCEEYAHGHEVAKLLGAPPGYVGADIEPLLSQARIDRAHWEHRREAAAQGDDAPMAGADAPTGDEVPATERPGGPNLPEALIDRVHDPERGLHSILLFDEVEKAHPTLWNALLGILDDGRVTLGNNAATDLTRSIILMTSNAGSREMGDAMSRRTPGFVVGEPGSPDGERLRQIARDAARDLFPAEFLNRFDEILVFEPLGDGELDAIFDKLLAEISDRAMERAGVPLLLRVSDGARDLVIREGTDPAHGARPLRRAVERLLVDPLSRLLASGQIVAGDVVDVEVEDGELIFFRLPRREDSVVA